MKASNSIVKKAPEKKPFSAVISGDGAQKLIRTALRSEKAAARFTGTLISVVNASEQLRECDAGSVISAALRGEGMGLTYGHGYYVVPYGQTATFIVGYKGYIQLALATGLYADVDCVEVREGERRGRDKRTGRPVVDMSVYDSDEERERHPIIGYKAYILLKDGYYREEYWTLDAVLRHADRYSKAFSLETWQKWQNGEVLDKSEQRAVENGPWYTSTDRMARKTVLKSLLNSGYAPLSNEMRTLFESDAEEEPYQELGELALPAPGGGNAAQEAAERPQSDEGGAGVESPVGDGTAAVGDLAARGGAEETVPDEDFAASFFDD